MTGPSCCGEPMEVQEYDSGDDAYLYVCQLEPYHHRWVTDDDEWK